MSSIQVQEKLATEGQCVVPKEVVMTMAKDDDIKLNLATARDLTRFIEFINIGLHQGSITELGICIFVNMNKLYVYT